MKQIIYNTKIDNIARIINEKAIKIRKNVKFSIPKKCNQKFLRTFSKIKKTLLNHLQGKFRIFTL